MRMFVLVTLLCASAPAVAFAPRTSIVTQSSPRAATPLMMAKKKGVPPPKVVKERKVKDGKFEVDGESSSVGFVDLEECVCQS